MSRILMVGGGSAGHLAPLIAVAEALEQLEPTYISFVCSDKPSDAVFLTMEKRPYDTLPPSLLRGLPKALCILKKEKPDVVFSKGSAVSVPLCLAALLNNIPIIIHESDATMGRANKVVSMFATKTLLGMDIGNPIRARITKGSKEEGLRITGFNGHKPVLIVTGGSQGALSINQAIGRHLDALLKTCDIIHLTGAGKGIAEKRTGYYASEFGSDVLPHLYAASDLAVSRAGAGSIAELAACNIPAILVPIKGLAGDHQVRNAEEAERTGAVIVLPQERLDDLPMHVSSLLSDPVRTQTMRERCRYAAKPEAARLIAQTVLSSVARKRTGA